MRRLGELSQRVVDAIPDDDQFLGDAVMDLPGKPLSLLCSGDRPDVVEDDRRLDLQGRLLRQPGGSGYLLRLVRAGSVVLESDETRGERMLLCVEASAEFDHAAEARLKRELEIINEELPDMRFRLAGHLRQKTSGFGVLN